MILLFIIVFIFVTFTSGFSETDRIPLEAIQVKQEELSKLLKDKNIIINNTIDNKIMLLNKKNKE